MRLSEIGEFGLIEMLAGTLSHDDPRVIFGIGDDAAVLSADHGNALLVTIDTMIEGIHFRRDTCTPEELGFKAMAINASDIAAMGGSPNFAVVSVSIPPNTGVEFIERVYSGFQEIASDEGISIVGGDTTGSESDLCITVALIGECPIDEVVYRSGAEIGDLIAVTGWLGDSSAGLALISDDIATRLPNPDLNYLRARHLKPHPRTAIGRAMARSRLINSMIDISDGLSSEIHHICGRSNVGARIICEQIPISKPLKRASSILGKSPYEFALNGGEDYELLFTVPKENERPLMALFDQLGEKCSILGEIVPPEEGIKLISESGVTPLLSGGYAHFR